LAHGGRAFAEHYHWAWIKSFPPAPSPRICPSLRRSAWTSPRGFPTARSNVLPSTPALVETSFPKGKDFAQWLLTVGAASTLGTMTFDPTDTTTKAEREGRISPRRPRRGAGSINPRMPPIQVARRPIRTISASMCRAAGQVIDRFDTTSTNMCGRFVYTGLHVAAASSGAHAPDTKDAFPTQCQAGDLSSYEKAIEFMLFDLSSCLTTDQSTVGQTIIF
jgi:hypothetical protein